MYALASGRRQSCHVPDRPNTSFPPLWREAPPAVDIKSAARAIKGLLYQRLFLRLRQLGAVFMAKALPEDGLAAGRERHLLERLVTGLSVAPAVRLARVGPGKWLS
jgi:hypothetical protein